MEEFINPYIVGNAISGESGFFGREDVIREVQLMLANPHANAIVLHGQRRIGKTSILLQLRRRLRVGGSYAPVYLDLQDKASLALEDLLYRLAQEIAEATDIAPPERQRFDENGDYFRRDFLPGISATIPLVLLFDEFDVLDSIGRRAAGQSFFPYLRTWMSSIRNVNFVFVLGRRPEDLSTETLSTFKGVRASRVSFIEKLDAEAVIRQSEATSGIKWQDSAVERIWEITRGHPYFTQLMGSVVLEGLQRDNVSTQSPIAPELVDAAVSQALKQGIVSFSWIWNGLPSAERVVLAAMAQAKEEVVSRDDLVDILNSGGLRLIVRELEAAPEILVEWEILRSVSDAFAFSVPLFRLWVSRSFTLRSVKKELDRLVPLAKNLFEAGQNYYEMELLEEAKGQLSQSLRINPNHLGARLLLGNIFLQEGETLKAVGILEEAYRFDYTARPDYVRALLASAEGATEEEQVNIYQKILSVEPSQRLAAERLLAIEEKQRNKEIADLEELAQLSMSEGDWEEARKYYHSIRQLAPEHPGLELRIQEIEREVKLLRSYAAAVEALENGDNADAARRLADIIVRQPDYKDAPRYLLRATKGIDIMAIEAELASTRNKLKKVREEFSAGRRLDNQDFMTRFREIFGAGDPEAMVDCPVCGVTVKGKNLLRHYIQRHSTGGQ